MSDRPVVMIVAGGTGGHLYPAIAVARELRGVLCDGPGWEAIFIVRQGDFCKDILRRDEFAVAELPGMGLPRTFTLRWLLVPLKMLAGFWGAWSLIRQLRPRVILGMGGYLTFPVLLAAKVLGIRTLIHEQNTFPGLANRMASRFAHEIAVSFDESRAYFPSSRTRVTGLPVREPIGFVRRESGRVAFQLSEELFTFLVFGGSQGAHRLNVITLEAWRLLMGRFGRFQVFHITGQPDFEYLKSAYRGFSFSSVVMPYCHKMAEAYAAADLVVCRSGASTIAELIASQRPAILVPYPHASNDHQRLNAEVLVRRRLAEMILEQDLTPETMANTLAGYLANPEKAIASRARYNSASLPSVGADATRKLASLIR